MSHRSSIYCLVAGEAPEWPPGARQDWALVTKPNLPIPPEVTGTADAWDVIHCAPGMEPPINATSVVVKGHETPWTPEMIVGGWPNGSPYVMEATVMHDGPMGMSPRRVKMIEIPEGEEPTATLLVPHAWAGDGA